MNQMLEGTLLDRLGISTALDNCLGLCFVRAGLFYLSPGGTLHVGASPD